MCESHWFLAYLTVALNDTAIISYFFRRKLHEVSLLVSLRVSLFSVSFCVTVTCITAAATLFLAPDII